MYKCKSIKTFSTFSVFSGVMPLHGQNNFCQIRPEYSQMLIVVGNIDAIITMVLPFLAILIFNGLILYTVFRYNSNRSRMVIRHNDAEMSTDGSTRAVLESGGTYSQSKTTPPSKSTSSIPLKRIDQNGISSDQSRSRTESRGKKKFSRTSSSPTSVMRMTKMLVIVSSSFLLLNLPSHSIRVYYFFVSWMNKYHLITHRLQSCLKLFRYTKFIIYHLIIQRSRRFQISFLIN